MSAAERLATHERGQLTFAECLHWGALAPHKPPLINGEFAYNAAKTPEVAETRR